MATTTFETGTVIAKEWLQDVNDVVYSVAGPDTSIDAIDVNITPVGNISSITVQDAIEELDTEKADVVHTHSTDNITTGTLPIARGGTGNSTAATARAALGAASSGVNTDITSLASPALASATATTQTSTDNSTKVATTAFVKTAIGTLSVVAVCYFNGTLTGTNAPISGVNVSTVTRNSTGNYTINFSSALTDTNYVVVASGWSSSSILSIVGTGSTKTTTQLGIGSFIYNTGAAGDLDRISVIVYKVA